MPRPRAAPGGSAEAPARLAETLDEVMGHYGRRAAAEMPALLHGIGIRALGRSRGPGRRPPRALGTALGAADVEAVERRQAYARFFGIEEHLLRHRRFDGGRSEPLERAVFTSGDAVVVLPWDPRRDAVLLIEQFRAGPFARRDPRPWRLETVAGRCDRNEPTEATARREAREEAGIELGRIERIAEFYPSPAIMSEFITAFVGEADLRRGGRRLRPARGARGHPRAGGAARRGAGGGRERRDRHGAPDAGAALAAGERGAAARRVAVRAPLRRGPERRRRVRSR